MQTIMLSAIGMVSFLPSGLDVFSFSGTALDMLTTLNRVVRADTLALLKGTQSQFWWQYCHPWGSVGKSQEKALGLGGHQEPAEAKLQQGAGRGPG